jgi:hypothetical protein
MPDVPDEWQIVDEDAVAREQEARESEAGDSSLAAGRTSDVPTASAAPIKRGRGRPKGTPKTGGRVKGSPRSYTAPEVRAELLSKSNFMDRMARIANGEKIWAGGKDHMHKAEWRVPTIEQQHRASV